MIPSSGGLQVLLTQASNTAALKKKGIFLAESGAEAPLFLYRSICSLQHLLSLEIHGPLLEEELEPSRLRPLLPP